MAELSAQPLARTRGVRGKPGRTRADKKGEAQQATAAGLDLLRVLGWQVLHDAAVPGVDDATVDHVLAGPTGVYVVNTVSWPGAISMHGKVLTVGGINRSESLTQVSAAADAVRDVLGGLPVAPMLCFERLEPVAGVVDDVALCASENILDLLTNQPQILDPAAFAKASRSLAGFCRPTPRVVAPVTVVEPAAPVAKNGSTHGTRVLKPVVLPVEPVEETPLAAVPAETVVPSAEDIARVAAFERLMSGEAAPRVEESVRAVEVAAETVDAGSRTAIGDAGAALWRELTEPGGDTDAALAEAEAWQRDVAEAQVREREVRERAAEEAREQEAAEAHAAQEARDRKAREARERVEHEARELAKQEERELAEREAKVRAEQEAKEQAEREAREAEARAAKELAESEARERAEQAARGRAQERARKRAEREAKARAKREAKEKAAQEARERAEREAREKAEREAKELAEREAKERAEREAREAEARAAQERAEREAREKAEREARERAEREAREAEARAAQERAEQEAQARAEQEARDAAAREAEARVAQEATERAEREARESEVRAAREQAEREAREAEARAAKERAEREAREAAQQRELDAEETISAEELARERAAWEAVKKAAREERERQRLAEEQQWAEELEAHEALVRADRERRAREAEVVALVTEPVVDAQAAPHQSNAPVRRRPVPTRALLQVALAAALIAVVIVATPRASGVVDWAQGLFGKAAPTTVGTVVSVGATTSHPDVQVLAGTPVDVKPPAGTKVAKGQHLVAVPLRLQNQGLVRWDIAPTARTTVVDELGVAHPFTKVASIKGLPLINGMQKVGPGAVVTGYVVFSVPEGRGLRSVKLTLGESGDAATWRVAP